MIYLDNAATTYQKPKTVIRAVDYAMKHYSANPGRSGHQLSLDASACIFDTRCAAADFFGISDCEQVVFTKNTTEALNLAIKGILRPFDHVILSGLEHNSVLRPIKKLSDHGISYDILPADEYGRVSLDDFEQLIRPETKLCVMMHASNVCGNLLPVEQMLEIAHSHGVLFLLDAAQTAGMFPIDLRKTPFDFVAAAGHKGLLGPQGTGLLILNSGMLLDTLMEGGTGSQSENEYQPEMLPDRFESGTLNTPGIAGLGEGIRYVAKNMAEIQKAEHQHMLRFLEGVRRIDGITLYGDYDSRRSHAPVVGLNVKELDSVTVANMLSEDWQIAVRGGLHCSYLAHKTFGTLHRGIVRFSFSHYNTPRDIQEAVYALKQIAKQG